MNMQTIKSKLVGDRQFYRKVLMVSVPIMIQNGITNFVNMLDNIMVGQVGTEQMSGVATAIKLRAQNTGTGHSAKNTQTKYKNQLVYYSYP